MICLPVTIKYSQVDTVLKARVGWVEQRVARVARVGWVEQRVALRNPSFSHGAAADGFRSAYAPVYPSYGLLIIGSSCGNLMRIIALSRLREFWENHPDAERPLKAWYAMASRAQWKNPGHVKQDYPTASILENNRIVFNIKGNAYRLIVAFHYDKGRGFIRFVGRLLNLWLFSGIFFMLLLCLIF